MTTVLYGLLRQYDSAFLIFELARYSNLTINYCAVPQCIQHSTVVLKTDFRHCISTLFEVIHCENADIVDTGNIKYCRHMRPHITITLSLVTEK